MLLHHVPIFPYTTLFRSAYLASMKADLRNGATYEESYAADSAGAYFSGNGTAQGFTRSEDDTSELQSLTDPVCRLILETNNKLTANTCTSMTHGYDSYTQ